MIGPDQIGPEYSMPSDVSPRPEGKVVVDKLTTAEIEEWWSVYDAQFIELNKTNPCRQSFNKNEFETAINDSRMAKLAYVDDGEIVAMCLLSNDFEHFPWLSEEFYKNKYPDHFEEERIYYFVSLLTKEEKRRQNFGSKVVELITELYKLDDNDAIITFDCCATNASFLPQMIEQVVEDTGMGELEFDELGTQHYFGGQLNLK